MLSPKLLATMALLAALLPSLHLAETLHLHNSEVVGQKDTPQAPRSGIIFKPGLMDDKFFPGELDLIEAWLPDLIERLSGNEKAESAEDRSRQS